MSPSVLPILIIFFSLTPNNTSPNFSDQTFVPDNFILASFNFLTLILNYTITDPYLETLLIQRFDLIAEYICRNLKLPERTRQQTDYTAGQ